jgi:hypothetical protein
VVSLHGTPEIGQRAERQIPECHKLMI